MDYQPDTAAFTAGKDARVHARATRRKIRSFFTAPSGTPNLGHLADFLQYAPGAPKIALPGPPEAQMRAALSGIRFRREVSSADAGDSGMALLNRLIAQSDHQNQLTSRFLSFLD